MLSAGGRQFGIMWNYSVRFKVKTLLKQLNRIFLLFALQLMVPSREVEHFIINLLLESAVTISMREVGLRGPD